jgi:hypothetical protein
VASVSPRVVVANHVLVVAQDKYTELAREWTRKYAM